MKYTKASMSAPLKLVPHSQQSFSKLFQAPSCPLSHRIIQTVLSPLTYILTVLQAGLTKAARAPASASVETDVDTVIRCNCTIHAKLHVKSMFTRATPRFSSNNVAAQRHFSTAIGISVLPLTQSPRADVQFLAQTVPGQSPSTARDGVVSPPLDVAATNTLISCAFDNDSDDQPCAAAAEGGLCNGSTASFSDAQIPLGGMEVASDDQSGYGEAQFDDNPLPIRMPPACPPSPRQRPAGNDASSVEKDVEAGSCSACVCNAQGSDAVQRATDVFTPVENETQQQQEIQQEQQHQQQEQQQEQQQQHPPSARRSVVFEDHSSLPSPPPPMLNLEYEPSILDETEINYK
jgi:hypothetical protein